MDKNVIKKYAVWARRELIARVAGKAASYDIKQEGCDNVNAESIDGRVLSSNERQQRAAFIAKIDQEGYEQAIEEVAYTWFNRFCALRYMEVNGYLPSHIRIFTNDAGEFKPQILDEAIHLDLNGLDMDKVYDYKDSDQEEELYRYLLIIQCNDLNSILPGMFQKIADYTELLLPDNLLREGSVIEQMVTQIPEEDWTDQVQIIGWLYQYYNAEKKDEVFAALKKNVKITKDNIPAATQLFTPDWIVRYMVENSLGRLWLEGHPNESLKGNWEYYIEEVKQEPEVEGQLAEIHKKYAALKPEDIKCIDPCCGSGHILVYMFDVLMQIYESYGYSVKDAVNSILENNLYGLDIDDRAAQLAYFSVMMKARNYDKKFFNRGIQPHVYAIQESESLSTELLDAYGSCKDIVKRLVDSFAEAKDLGSLIEPNITLEELNMLEKQMREMDYMSNVECENDALFTYTSLDFVSPLLPVAKALIQNYDVVITNPPYMGSNNMNKRLNNFVKKNYPVSKSDMFAVFTERCEQMTKQLGFQAMIVQPSLLSLSSFEKLRDKILYSNTMLSLLDMGRGIFGIDFGSTAFVIRRSECSQYKSIYFRLKQRMFQYITPEDICSLFLEAKNDHSFKYDFNRYDTEKNIKKYDNDKNAQQIYFIAKQSNFSKIPGAPVAYWVSEAFTDIFTEKSIGDYAEVITGMTIGDNNLYLRLWYEVDLNKTVFNAYSMDLIDLNNTYWIPYSKGGSRRNWYGNYEYIVNWREKDNFNRSKTTLQRFYLREGLTWPFVASGGFSARFLPIGFLWDVAGSPCFFEDEEIEFYALGAMCSKPVNYILRIMNPTINVQAIDISRVPLPSVDKELMNVIEETVSENICLSKSDWDSYETSWDFTHHPLVCNVSNIACAYDKWKDECNSRFYQLKSNEEKLNKIFIKIYNLQDELTPDEEDNDVTVRKADLQQDIKTLISYAVGCMFGRYSLGVDGLAYAGGEWNDTNYSTFIPDSDGIIPICDDEYFTDDIVGRFVEFIRVVYGEDTLEDNLKFIADALGGSGTPRQVIRKYFLNDFYKDHCKTYQKRPIYWLFDSGKKNGFKCLIYMHRYQPDMIARIRTDYVHEQQARYRTAMADLQERIKGASTSDQIKFEKQLAKLQDQAEELQGYEEKIHHLADQFIDIDLDDGVKVNYAKFQDVLAKIK